MNSRRRAFTLMELLVVIIILTSLMAMAVVGYSRFFAQGDAVQVVSGGWSTLQPAVDTVQSTLDVLVVVALGEGAGGQPHRIGKCGVVWLHAPMEHDGAVGILEPGGQRSHQRLGLQVEEAARGRREREGSNGAEPRH